MSKFFNEKIFVVPGAKRPFHNKKDALYWCQDNGISKDSIDCYDSKKEYDRYLILLLLQKQGEIRELKRQVEFEIIPKHSELVKIGTKKVKSYCVNKKYFDTKKAAIDYCKEYKIPQSFILSCEEEKEIIKEKVIENNAVYTADFTYYNKQDDYVVEDVKSDYTRKEKDYVLRRKLMLDRYGIRIIET